MDGYPRPVGLGPAIVTPTVEVVFVGALRKHDAEGVVLDLEWSPIPIQPPPDRCAANLAFSDRSAEVKLHLTGLSPLIGAWLRTEALTITTSSPTLARTSCTGLSQRQSLGERGIIRRCEGVSSAERGLGCGGRRSRGPVRRDPQPNGECPVCHRSVVVGGTTRLGNMYTGPMMVPPTRQELVNACAIHGRSPFNDATVKAVGGEPPD